MYIEFKDEYGHLEGHSFTENVKPTIERLIKSMIGVVKSYGSFCKSIVFEGVEYTDFEQVWDALRKWAKTEKNENNTW